MKRAIHILLMALALLTCISLAGKAEPVSGKVVGIQDGDTLTLLTPAKEQIKVRLEGIDAPESKQPFGSVSKQSLSDMVFGKNVTIEVSGKDRYRRTLAHVYAGTMWVNLEQVRRGYAWQYTKYSKDAQIRQAELEAREARRGLWQHTSPVAPWDWRMMSKKKAAP